MSRQSIAYISGSDGSGNAAQMTIQTIRSPGSTAIAVNTVTGVSAKFYGSMGTPHTFTDPVTNEVITIISDATAVDFAGHVNAGALVIDAIAPGYTDAGSKVGDIVVVKPVTEWANNIHDVLAQAHADNGDLATGAIKTDSQFATIVSPVTRLKESFGSANFIASGCVWTADAAGSTKNASMSAGVVYIAGARLTVAAITAHVFTASKDTFVDFQDNGDGTAKVIYTEASNNGAGATIPNSQTVLTNLRNARIITNASNITSTAASIDQYTVDSLGNFIGTQAPGTSRTFTLASGSTWRVTEFGNTRKYKVQQSWAGGSQAASSSWSMGTITTPFSSSCTGAQAGVATGWLGGYPDQTAVSFGSIGATGVAGGSFAGSLQPFGRNLYSGGSLTFGVMVAWFEFTFAQGQTTF